MGGLSIGCKQVARFCGEVIQIWLIALSNQSSVLLLDDRERGHSNNTWHLFGQFRPLMCHLVTLARTLPLPPPAPPLECHVLFEWPLKKLCTLCITDLDKLTLSMTAVPNLGCVWSVNSDGVRKFDIFIENVNKYVRRKKFGITVLYWFRAFRQSFPIKHFRINFLDKNS